MLTVEPLHMYECLDFYTIVQAGKETDCYIYVEVDWARTYYDLGR